MPTQKIHLFLLRHVEPTNAMKALASTDRTKLRDVGAQRQLTIGLQRPDHRRAVRISINDRPAIFSAK
jgi:hypothetical protein